MVSELPLSCSLVVVEEDFPFGERDAVLQALAARMAGLFGAGYEAAVLCSAREREVLEPTYIGRGVAVPHARVAGLPGAAVLVARCARGVAWPVEPAHLIVFFAVPEERPDVYLRLLGGVMRWRHGVGLSQEGILAMGRAELVGSLRGFLGV